MSRFYMKETLSKYGQYLENVFLRNRTIHFAKTETELYLWSKLTNEVIKKLNNFKSAC